MGRFPWVEQHQIISHISENADSIGFQRFEANRGGRWSLQGGPIELSWRFYRRSAIGAHRESSAPTLCLRLEPSVNPCRFPPSRLHNNPMSPNTSKGHSLLPTTHVAGPFAQSCTEFADYAPKNSIPDKSFARVVTMALNDISAQRWKIPQCTWFIWQTYDHYWNAQAWDSTSNGKKNIEKLEEKVHIYIYICIRSLR